MSFWSNHRGAIIGGATLGVGTGGLIGLMHDKKAAAQAAADESVYNQQQLVNSEIGRRKKNVSDIRSMYGDLDSNMNAGQIAQAQRMGGKLNTGINQQVQADTALAAQQNLSSTSAGLQAVNAASALSGNKGSAIKHAQGGVMGSFLGNQQNIATGAEAGRRMGASALDAQKTGLVQSALGGSQNISPTLVAQQQASSMNQARANIPMNIMGGQIAQLAQTGVNSSLMNQAGYNTPNFMGPQNLSAPGQKPFIQKG